MIRRLVIAGVAAAAVVIGSIGASADTGAPSPSKKELCLVLGGAHSQAYCVNWSGAHQTH